MSEPDLWFSRRNHQARPERQLAPGEKANRWMVTRVTCLDCVTEFGVEPSCVDPDVGRGPGQPSRILLVWVPDMCPKCRNLKLVEEEDVGGEDVGGDRVLDEEKNRGSADEAVHRG